MDLAQLEVLLLVSPTTPIEQPANGRRRSSLIARPCQLRRSISEHNPARNNYRNSFPNASTSALDDVPSYEEGLKLPPPRFKILPREEEGREELPGYQCSVHREAVFEVKMEMCTPFDRAPKRNWKRCYVVLEGTKLEMYEPKNASSFRIARKPSWLRGRLLDSYTLQYAEVGAAQDYRKKNFVIRLRVHTQQFLIACRTVEPFLEWMEALSTAIGLSPSLEERSLPTYRTIPRRRRRTRPINGRSSNSRNANSNSDPTDRNRAREPCALEAALDLEPRSSSPRHNYWDDVVFDDSGKWAPRCTLTPAAHLQYMKRCMAVLCNDTPRQTDYVIENGKRMVIEWSGKRLVSDDGSPIKGLLGLKGRVDKGKGKAEEPATRLPPNYEEVVGRFLAGVQVS